MKKIALICAALSLSASVAFGATVTVGSYATGASAGSNQNTAVNYDGFISASSFVANPSAFISSGTHNTFAVDPNGVWTNPIAGSTYVSLNSHTGPGGSVIEPNGYYTYDTTFTATAGSYAGTLSLLADDTVAVYLNGQNIVLAALGGNSTCQNNVPNCTTVDTVNFAAILNGGVNGNKLTFVVEQTNLHAEGLDFKGSFTASPTPEPSSLVLLGTGIVGLAGAVRRKLAL